MLQCYQLDPTLLILRRNPSQSCGTDQYHQFKAWFIIPQLILWVFVFPASILALMIRQQRKKKLFNNKANSVIFGFVFFGYKRRYLVGEFFKLFLRYQLVITFELMVDQVKLREIFAATFFWVISFWIYHNKLYKDDVC